MMFTLLSGAARNPGHGTRNCKMSSYFLVTKLFMLQSDATTILVMAPEMQEVSLYKFILMFMS